MIKIILVSFMLFSVLVFTGCGGNSNKEIEKPQKTTSVETKSNTNLATDAKNDKAKSTDSNTLHTVTDAEIKKLTSWGYNNDLTVEQVKKAIILMKKANVNFDRIKDSGKDLVLASLDGEVNSSYVLSVKLDKNGQPDRMTLKTMNKFNSVSLFNNDSYLDVEDAFMKEEVWKTTLGNMANHFKKEKEGKEQKIVSADFNAKRKENFLVPTLNSKSNKIALSTAVSINYKQDTIGGAKEKIATGEYLLDNKGNILKGTYFNN